jgi:DNA polymerase I
MFKVDFVDGKAVEWHRNGDSVEKKVVSDYHPRFYLNASRTDLMKSRTWIAARDEVVSTSFETWRPTLSESEKRVLRVDTVSNQALRKTVKDLKSNFERSRFRFYNVDFTPQFRYCIQKNIEPTPDQELEKLDLRLTRRHIADEDISKLRVNGERIGCSEDETLQNLKYCLNETDIVLVNRAQVLKLLQKTIGNSKYNYSLGRLDRFEKLAGENTVSSYGKTVHSAARYNVPGRIVIDRSNSFLLGEATMEGLWNLVSRSHKPMQELAWGSIGNVLTAIEVRKAYLEKGILTP